MFGAAVVFLAVADNYTFAQGESAPPSATEQVTVRGENYVLRRTPVSGRQYGLMNVEIISTSKPVSYADLDLSTSAGAVELEKRINDTARDICRDLNTLTPRAIYRVVGQDCVKSAVDEAMIVANQVIIATMMPN
jgi:UrcA family protein